ncbi:MAG: hypothetical protein JWN44_6199 [Myxococcales bacterium]|nr:hypothetical protein [Myxococcales bacterium]
MRTPIVRNLLLALAGLVAGCGSNNSGPTRRVSASGTTCCIVTDEANGHVAYLLNAVTAVGGKGELHVASADGKDVKVASGISPGGFLVSPTGKALFYAELLPSGSDASLSYLDLSTAGAQPKILFASGWPTRPVTPGVASSPQYATIEANNFFSPSGRYFVLGILPPNVSGIPDLHVIDVETGTDVFQRGNGAYAYLEAVLPDDTMVFQDAVGGNSGVNGPPGVQTLFWIALPQAASMQPVVIDTFTGALTFTSDNKTLVYQRTDRSLWSWDAVARPAKPTMLAANTVQYSVSDAGQGTVAYSGTDHSLHVAGTLDLAGATAKVDTLSPIVLSADGADVYYFQNVETQNRRGTLMHAGTAAGATPTKIADNASIYDVHPVPGALLYLQNVDAVGEFGDAVRAARDGSAATPLGTHVPTTGIGLAKLMGTSWLAAHLTSATLDKDKKLVDAAPALVGALGLTTSAGGGDTTVDPATRQGQFAVSDDQKSLVYIGGVAFDAVIDNYVGALARVAVSAPSMTLKEPLLTGATEIGPVVGTTLFCNAPKASTPGVYFVNFTP